MSIEFVPPKNKSSQIAAVGHDGQANILAVRFASGQTYHYAGVSAQAFEALRDADSAGKYLHSQIKSNPEKHPFTKQEDPIL